MTTAVSASKRMDVAGVPNYFKEIALGKKRPGFRSAASTVKAFPKEVWLRADTLKQDAHCEDALMTIGRVEGQGRRPDSAAEKQARVFRSSSREPRICIRQLAQRTWTSHAEGNWKKYGRRGMKNGCAGRGRKSSENNGESTR